MERRSRQRCTSKGALAKLEGALKLRFLGVGCIWAWIYASFQTFAVYPERNGIAINADASWIVSATVVVATFWIGGVILGQRNRPLGTPWIMAAAVLVAGGTLISAIPDSPHAFDALRVYVSGISTGLGSGLLNILWGQTLARLDREQTELAIPSASLIMLASALILPYLPRLLGTLATASLPIASGVMLLLTYQELARKPSEQSTKSATASPRRDKVPMGRLSALLFFSYCAIGCAEALQVNADAPFMAVGLDVSALIGSCCGIALVVALVFFAARPSFDALFRLIAPLIVSALALLPWADLWAVFLGTTFISISNMVLTITAVLFVVTAAQSGLVNPALGIGVTQGSLQLGVLVGNVLGTQASAWTAHSASALFATTLALTVLFSLSWLFFPSYRPSRKGARSEIPGKSSSNVEASSVSAMHTAGIAEPGRDSSIDAVCRALTEAHGLSGRESEILGYLARGRSQPYIREELVLSKNTVATHVKHIYQKLNVHSRQELLDLFE